jgi:alpha-tubulin suppressor-like RCC1 family protein
MMRKGKWRNVLMLSLAGLLLCLMMPPLAFASDQAQFFYDEKTGQITGVVHTKEASEVKFDITYQDSSQNKLNMTPDPKISLFNSSCIGWKMCAELYKLSEPVNGYSYEYKFTQKSTVKPASVIVYINGEKLEITDIKSPPNNTGAPNSNGDPANEPSEPGNSPSDGASTAPTDSTPEDSAGQNGAHPEKNQPQGPNPHAPANVPVTLTSSDITTIAMSPDGLTTYALKKDGTVLVWGNVKAGTFTDMQKDGTTPPRPYGWGLVDVHSMATGSGLVFFIYKDGQVTALGDDYNKLLGGMRASTLFRIKGLDQVVSMSVGAKHVLALNKDGTVMSWGNNEFGQLGDGTTTSRTEPQPISGLHDIVAISAGTTHSLALDSSGTVWAWGDNSNYALGTTDCCSDETSPQQVAHFNDVEEIAAGAHTSVVKRKDGTLWFWGINDGQTTITDLDQIREDEEESKKHGEEYVHYSPENIREEWRPVWFGREPVKIADDVKQIVGVTTASLTRGDEATIVYFTKNDDTAWRWDPRYFTKIEGGEEKPENPDFESVPLPGNDEPMRLYRMADINGAVQLSFGHRYSMVMLKDHTMWGWGGDPNEPIPALAYEPRDDQPIAKGALIPANLINNRISVILNGETLSFEQLPVIKNGVTMVPMRKIFETLGATIQYEESTRTITATKEDTVVTLQIGSDIMTVNGKQMKLEVAPGLINGHTMVPVRAVSESLKSEVTWDAATLTIFIKQL